MRNVPISRSDIVAWVATAVALGLVLELHLLSGLLAGLLVYTLVEVLTPRLRLQSISHDAARIAAVAIIAVVVIAALIGLVVGAVATLRSSGEGLPRLLKRMAEILEESRYSLPSWLTGYVPSNASALQQTLVDWLRGNADDVTVFGRGVGRSLAHILMGMVIGALLSLQKAAPPHERRPLTELIAAHASRLANVFRRVVFAQIWISLINTFFTWLYLDLVLRLFGVDLPLVKTLVALTFVCGLLPIIGNLISNTAIVIVCLSQGAPLAAVSLLYLVVIHKLEYFLNARIVGTHINARAWELLIAMLVMQAAFGIAGLIAAPIFYAFFKDELRDKGLV